MTTLLRRGLRLSLLSALLLAPLSALPAQGATATAAAVPATPQGVRRVGPIALTVSDIDRSVAFYTTVLDFAATWDTVLSDPMFARLSGVRPTRVRLVTLALGDETLQLMQWLDAPGRPAPTDARSNDAWFQHVAIIVSDMARAYARLKAQGVVHVSPAPQRLPDWNPAAGGIEAFYFHDPDGHPLEVLAFPPGKGSAKWHDPRGRLFLGIDHTAIVVTDTERSLAFYRDLLGLQVAGESHNYGPEQARLNNVAGAELRITGLRAAEGPGIEFLEYLSPKDGRPTPEDFRANDLVHWQTVLTVVDLDAATQAARAVGLRLESPLPVTLGTDALGYRRAVVVRDPDGHAVQLIH